MVKGGKMEEQGGGGLGDTKWRWLRAEEAGSYGEL